MSSQRTGQRIALIYALHEFVTPANEAFERCWPEASGFELFDSSLAVDLVRQGGMDNSMMKRFAGLSGYARGR